MGVYYPPIGFYFKLSFPDVNSTIDYTFQEVSGIQAEMGFDEIQESGEDRFKHKVQSGAKNNNLVLKRGLVTSNSTLAKWFTDTISSDLSTTISTKNISITLMDDSAKAIMTWTFVNAWPVKWSISDLKSINGEIAVESLEFAYNYFKLVS